MTNKKQILFTPLIYIASWYLIMVADSNLKLNSLLIFKGFLSYFFLGLSLSLISSAGAKVSRISLWVVLVVFFTLDTEHIYTNFSHINFKYLHLASDASLTLGAILNTNVLIIFLYNVTLFSVCATLVSAARPIQFPKLILHTLLPISIFIACSVRFTNPIYPTWYFQNPLAFQFNSLSPQRVEPNLVEKTERVSNKLNTITSDLYDSEKIKNIIVLVLEGFSQKHIDQGIAPFLGTLSTKALHVPKFINNHTQTNRGLYALLCGDYPNLINFEAKADILLAQNNLQHCLPHTLHTHGFTNFFTQSAPLNFMSKHLFAKAAGYDFAIGAKSFPENFYISEWGISDNALLASILQILDNNKEQKNFISALTVGTHHPFTTPVSTGSLEKAITYTDQIIGSFYLSLLKRDFFKDGILFITSDETKPIKEPENALEHNLGLMIILSHKMPEIKHQNIFSQIDLADSIKDLLGEEIDGRSFFKKYNHDQRDIYFSHAFRDRLSVIHAPDSLTTCNKNLSCVSSLKGKSVFRGNLGFESAPKKTIEKIKTQIQSSDLSFSSIKNLFVKRDFAYKKGTRELILAELKTSPQSHAGLKISIDYQYSSKGLSPNKLTWRYYPCFQVDKLQKKEFTLNFSKDSFVENLSLPKEFENVNICHSIEIINNGDIEIKDFKITR